ncbi:restriction endonuclease [Streptomyces sp. NPDC090023]|uniref:restriction endonuclease n=1 Tax=unclassified Streptomyces TaxID=2593676 RepID=UPI0038135696
MHINWATKATFPHYPGSELPQTLRREISVATDDELLAAYLHWTEARIAIDFALAANDLTKQIKTERDRLPSLSLPFITPFTSDYQRARRALWTVLCDSSRTAKEVCDKAWAVWHQLCEQTSSDLTTKYREKNSPLLDGAERIGTLNTQIRSVEQEVQKALNVFRSEMHRLALAEQAHERFLKSPDSYAVEEIHVMTPSAFEQTVAALARRDGHRVIRDGGGARDLGADVIAATAEGQRIVFQCKHRTAGRGKVGSPDIQTLNGTARPEHNADIVIAVTNGTFTKPAIAFARTHDIHLLDQVLLKRWGTWGEPLLAVLDIAAEPQSAHAA